MLDFVVVGTSSSSCTLLLAKASTCPTEKRKPKKKESKAANMTVLAGVKDISTTAKNKKT
jgi:hypothetical protein